MPNKVYVKKEKNNVVYSLSVQYDNGGEEYIRKNTLIEWASNMLGQVSDMGFDDGDVEHGYTRALQDIIEHLNEI